MGSLSGVIADICPKLRPPLDPAAAQLMFNKKAVDLNVPFRLLNIPAGSKLELVRGSPQPAAAVGGGTQAQEAAPGASDAGASGPLQQPQAGGGGGTGVEAASTSPAGGGSSADAGGSSGAASAPDPAGPCAQEASEGVSSSALRALGISHPLHVFNQRAVEVAAEAARASVGPSTDLPDEFYEFTAEDFAALQRAADAKRKAADRFVMRAQREADEAARAQRYAPVTVRLHWPDGSIVQAAFKATDTLGLVQELARACSQAGLAPGLYLYTAPPKEVLRDGGKTLHAARLVPAAHIYVGFDEKKLGQLPGSLGPFLRPEVAELMKDEVPLHRSVAAQATEASGGSSAASLAASSGQQRMRAAGAGLGGVGSAGGKVPKWLKLSQGGK